MDQDTYMLGIDKCFTNLEQANDRVEVLGETNSNVRAVETKLTQKDEETGCLRLPGAGMMDTGDSLRRQ